MNRRRSRNEPPTVESRSLPDDGQVVPREQSRQVQRAPASSYEVDKKEAGVAARQLYQKISNMDVDEEQRDNALAKDPTNVTGVQTLLGIDGSEKNLFVSGEAGESSLPNSRSGQASR